MSPAEAEGAALRIRTVKAVLEVFKCSPDVLHWMKNAVDYIEYAESLGAQAVVSSKEGKRLAYALRDSLAELGNALTDRFSADNVGS